MKHSLPVCLTFVLIIVSLSPVALFAAPSSADLGGVDQKLTILETKVNRLNTIQTQIIEKQKQIKEELDDLRIWIHRK